MTWYKVDDKWPLHPKFLTLSNDAVACWHRGLAYCSLYLTDGHLPRPVEPTLCGGEPDAIDELVEAGLWVEGEDGWWVANYLEHQRSRAEIEAERDKNRTRKRKSRGESRRDSGRTDKGSHGGSHAGVTPPETETETETETDSSTHSVELVLVDDHPAGSTAVEQVFEAWKRSAGKTNATKLDAKRRRCIQQALKQYPLADVLDAVDGWRFSPHHAGQNERQQVYNDLTLLLRDADRIEKFRDLARGDGPAPARAEPKAFPALRAWATEDR